MTDPTPPVPEWMREHSYCGGGWGHFPINTIFSEHCFPCRERLKLAQAVAARVRHETLEEINRELDLGEKDGKPRCRLCNQFLSPPTPLDLEAIEQRSPLEIGGNECRIHIVDDADFRALLAEVRALRARLEGHR